MVNGRQLLMYILPLDNDVKIYNSKGLHHMFVCNKESVLCTQFYYMEPLDNKGNSIY